MRVQEIMSTSVRSIEATAEADEAWELMRRFRIHHLIVKDGQDFVGIISDRDLGGRHGAAVRAERTVRELMTSGLVKIDQAETVRRAASRMRGRTVGSLAVTHDGELVGIVTTSDLLSLVGHGIDRPAEPERHNLHYRVPHRKQHGSRAW